MVKQISDNEIYLLIKYIKSVLWRVAKCLSYIEEVRCLKVNATLPNDTNLRYPPYNKFLQIQVPAILPISIWSCKWSFIKKLPYQISAGMLYIPT